MLIQTNTQHIGIQRIARAVNQTTELGEPISVCVSICSLANGYTHSACFVPFDVCSIEQADILLVLACVAVYLFCANMLCQSSEEKLSGFQLDHPLLNIEFQHHRRNAMLGKSIHTENKIYVEYEYEHSSQQRLVYRYKAWGYNSQFEPKQHSRLTNAIT